MKLQVRLTLTMSMVMFFIVLVLLVTTLTRSCILQTQAATDNLRGISGIAAKDIQRRLDLYLEVATTLANIMVGYDVIDPDQRRIRYDDMLFSVIAVNPHFIDVYTVWRPQVLDGLDSQYANTPGSNATGQYISMYTQETNSIEYRAHPDPQSLLLNLTDRKSIGNPVTRMVGGRETYVTSLNAPIVESDGTVVGLVGINVDLAEIQSMIAEIKPYGTGKAVMLANNGVVMAHYDPTQIGTRFQQVHGSVLGETGVSLILDSLQTGTPKVFKNESGNQEMVSYPFYVGNTLTPMTVLASAPEEMVLAQVTAMTRFNTLIAVLCILAGGVITFLMAGSIAKPILQVSAMLKDISQGEGDLTKRIAITTKDEIEDLAHYFNLTIEKIRSLIVIIKQQSISLFDIGSELSSNMTETAAA
ncbi:MAG: methyl-accepting chemotaxis protein, partial [Treponema sp.]|nr:methyl-accepting chemotaxis protein [Treponema sp.]